MTGREATIVKGKKGGESQRKHMFKTRHFLNFKSECRVALRGTRVTVSIWDLGQGRWVEGRDATKMLGIQSLPALSPARQETGLGLSLPDRASETLSECVINAG